MKLSSNDYEDDFETDDSGIEDVVIEAAPLVTNVEKNKEGEAKNSKGRVSRKARTGVVTSPSIGPWERWEIAASESFRKAMILRHDASLVSRFIRDLESASQAAIAVAKDHDNKSALVDVENAYTLQAAFRTIVKLVSLDVVKADSRSMSAYRKSQTSDILLKAGLPRLMLVMAESFLTIPNFSRTTHTAADTLTECIRAVGVYVRERLKISK